MGGVLSKGRPAAPSVDISSQHVRDENAANGHDAQNMTAAASAEQNGQLEVTHMASPSQASDSSAASTSKLPQDMQFILESGLHEEQEPDQAAIADGRQGSIQDAVNDIKAKYNLNQPVATGELERIRKEIELKTRLMQMREAQQQKRMAAAAAASATNSTSSTSTSDELGSSAKLPAYKVDVKGKGRADQQSDSEEDEDSSSSEDEESGSESSSSSGSSIGLKRTNNKGKPQHDDEDSEGEGSDDDFVSGNLKPEEIAAAAAAFASAHEVLEPNLPPPPVDSIPLDAPIRSIGFIDHIINSVIVIRADINSEESIQGQILDEGSLLCLSDRRVLGAIFETFGSINAPYYSIRLPPGHQLIVKRTTSDGGESEPVQPGMQVYYSPTPDFSGLLYTRDIRQMQMKGSDASNLYDEEVGENEIEFSDDEQETAYRRDLKQRKKERWMDKHQGAQPDSAEFEFDEDFDDTASLRSNADRSVETALHDSEEEGAIAEATGSHKRRLSTSTVASQQSGQHNKSARMDGHSGHTRGRGGRQDRGRGRGRGVSGGPNGQSRGRGGARRGAERGRGPGPRGGSFIGQRSPPTHQARPHLPQGLPPRPSYQHPDALPYDDVPTAAFAAPRSVSPTRAQHALPARPSTGVEAYDPSVPHGHALPPPRGMNALAPSWSPVQGGPGSPGSYVPSVPFFGQHMPQQYLPPTFGGQQVYNQAAQSYMQPGQYYVPHAHSADRNTGDQYQPR